MTDCAAQVQRGEIQTNVSVPFLFDKFSNG